MFETSYKPWLIFSMDMNADGRFTISDVSIWLYRGFFLPGDSLLWALSSYAPQAARFLELGTADYGGVVSAVVSGLSWLTATFLLGACYSSIRRLDWLMTVRLSNLYREAVRRARVARNRLGRKPPR